MKNMVKKYVALILILVISLFSLSGCIGTQNIDDLAYVVALGLDIGDTNTLKISFQIGIPSGSNSGGSGGSSSSSPTDTISSVECNSIDSGINLVNNYLSKELNLSHCEVIIISEELAQKGISEYIYTLVNNIQVRPNTYFVVSRGDAKSFLENSIPVLETLTSKYYQIIPATVQDTGYSEGVTIRDFFSNLNDSTRQAYAILGSVNKQGNNQQNTSIENTQYNSSANVGGKEDANKAGETQKEDKSNNIEIMGLAIFNGDILVGELNAIQSISHLLLTNKLQNCTITMPNPLDNTSTIDLRVQMDKRTKSKVKLINSSPYITSKITVKARILSMTDNSKYLNDDNLKIIENHLSLYLEDQITEYCYKTSKIYHSDIAGFGKYAVGYFSTLDKWKNYNWLDNYKNAFFKVEVESKVKSAYLLLDS